MANYPEVSGLIAMESRLLGRDGKAAGTWITNNDQAIRS